MKKIFVVWAALLAVLVALAQEKPADAQQQKAVEAYMKMGAVNENHEFMKKYAGNWQVQTTAWMAPGQPPALSRSTARGEMALGGRFLLMNFRGEMFGQPFEGMQIVGYDNLQKKYITFWIDSTSTFFFLTSGTRLGNTINEAGFWPDPLTGAQVTVKARTVWVGPDEYTYEQFMVMPDGSEFKSMENRCTRIK